MSRATSPAPRRTAIASPKTNPARLLKAVLSLGRRAAPAPSAEIARALIARADGERDRRSWRPAAMLYEEALRIAPDDAAIHVQCGHMFKEAGDLARAETHYLRALKLTPEDPDLALQLGHFYKIAGRSEASEAAYRRAAELSPGWAEPAAELARISGSASALPASGRASEWDRLVPELFPVPEAELSRTWVDSLHVRRLGSRRERTASGVLSTLRGIEAIRGFCISSDPVDAVEIVIGGKTVAREASVGVDLPPGNGRRRKFVFNIWLDVSDLPPGPCQVEINVLAGGRRVQGRREAAAIGPPLAEADHPDSDGVVTLSPGDPRAVEVQVNARPSVRRPARRSVLPDPPRNILVLRTDQLGDMVTSLPALRRLRELFPDARIVGLVTAGNADFAATLRLFDEIIVVDFPDDLVQRRRVMPPDRQEALRKRLEPYAFDIALDLAESAVSRPLLLLSGARFLYGFHDHEWPWLTAGFGGGTRDPRNGLEAAAQSTRVLGFIERLGATLNSRARIERRPELSRDRLLALGLGPDDRYAVLHAGARIAFSWWPHYGELAARLLRETGLKVVLITEGALNAVTVPEEIAGSDRLRVIDGRLAFDDFDALLSFAEVFVGNDSGPKHLAALRGSRVVSLHSARINWNEWGQELSGQIISRRVPCAGCALFHDADECGKDFACIRRITVDEVVEAVMDELGRPAPQA